MNRDEIHKRLTEYSDEIGLNVADLRKIYLEVIRIESEFNTYYYGKIGHQVEMQEVLDILDQRLVEAIDAGGTEKFVKIILSANEMADVNQKQPVDFDLIDLEEEDTIEVGEEYRPDDEYVEEQIQLIQKGAELTRRELREQLTEHFYQTGKFKEQTYVKIMEYLSAQAAVERMEASLVFTLDHNQIMQLLKKKDNN